MTLPTAPQARKEIPLCTGVLDYFPSALCAVAECSRAGNEQHNPGAPLHWDRAKSQDEGDALMRHLLQRGTIDTDGIRHSTKVAWRALALLQKELEAAAAPVFAHTPHFRDTAAPGPVVHIAIHPPLINPLPRPDEIDE